MKKTAVLLVFMLVSAGIFAEGLSFSLSSGVSYCTEDTSDLEDMGMDVNVIGFPVSLEVLYSLGEIVEGVNLDVGLKGGYLHLLTATIDKLEMSVFTIPVLAYGKGTMGNFFVGVGLGVHAWNMAAKLDGKDLDDYSDNGIEFCALVEPGYKMALTDNLSLLGSVSLYTTTLETEDGEESESNAITLNIGVNYAL